MGANDFGKSGLALMMTGSADQPQWLAVGSGSGGFVGTVGSLTSEVFGERLIFTSRSSAVNQNVILTFDRGSVSMSGVQMKEFGVGAGSTVAVQDLWMDEHFPNITFDGSNEAQFEITFETF